jgi:hypothetical protein
MIFEIDEQEFKSLYNRAKKNYDKCIGLEENAFLKEEVKIPLKFISVDESDIKIVFSHKSTDTFLVEVCLTLSANNRIIGKYVYIENEKGIPIDDSLVFY